MVCFLGVGDRLYAQDILESIKKTAQMENEAKGNQETGNDGNLSYEDASKLESLLNYLDVKLSPYLPLLEELEDPNLKCLAMMLLYFNGYSQLELKAHGTDEAIACKKKYELYGMLLLANTNSTSIMYCPEGMDKLSNEELGEILSEFVYILRLEDRHPNKAYRELWIIYDRMLGRNGLLGRSAETIGDETPGPDDESSPASDGGIVRLLIKWFSPELFVRRTLWIGQEMESLGCSN